MFIPQFLQTEGYEVREIFENLEEGRIVIRLHRKLDRPYICHRCGTGLQCKRGTHPLQLKEMPMGGYAVFIHVTRWKGYCPECKKARSEDIPFIADHSPHLTKNYAWWLGKLSEITQNARAAKFTGNDEMTMWRADLARMKQMLVFYDIPDVTSVSVDEVYARKKAKKGETRNDRFFTIITDLKSHKIIWIEEGRSKLALDRFFQKIGKERCKKIKIAAMDQFDGYANSVKEYCPNATLVWDRFHIIQNFEKAVNETRKLLHDLVYDGRTGPGIYSAGKYRFIFLKKASRRTPEESRQIEKVLKDNESFATLELIKERMITFFDERDSKEALEVFKEIGRWIFEAGFLPLKKWFQNLARKWTTLRNYFTVAVLVRLGGYCPGRRAKPKIDLPALFTVRILDDNLLIDRAWASFWGVNPITATRTFSPSLANI